MEIPAFGINLFCWKHFLENFRWNFRYNIIILLYGSNMVDDFLITWKYPQAEVLLKPWNNKVYFKLVKNRHSFCAKYISSFNNLESLNLWNTIIPTHSGHIKYEIPDELTKTLIYCVLVYTVIHVTSFSFSIRN